MRGSKNAFISQRYCGKHFSAITLEAFRITKKWEASTDWLAFRSTVAGSISQRLRGKHFSSLNRGKHQQYCWHFAALSPEAFHIVKVDGKHQHMLAFRSAFAGSISHRQGGREASAYCWLFEQICFVFCLCLCGCVCVCVCAGVADWFWQKASL